MKHLSHLTNIVSRHTGTAETARPRMRSHFEDNSPGAAAPTMAQAFSPVTETPEPNSISRLSPNPPEPAKSNAPHQSPQPESLPDPTFPPSHPPTFRLSSLSPEVPGNEPASPTNLSPTVSPDTTPDISPETSLAHSPATGRHGKHDISGNIFNRKFTGVTS